MNNKILLLAALSALPATSQAAPVEVSHLTCESLVNPLGIDIVKPRLAWRMIDTTRGQKQTAYQILVASAPQVLAKDRGDLWDSGKVVTAQAAHITYAGKPLNSHALAFWKVRVWDKANQASSWSIPAHWSIGLLSETEWKAEWIGRDDAKPIAAPGHEVEENTLDKAQWIWTPDGDLNGAPAGQRYFRRDFELPAKPRRAILLMAVDDKSTLTVNGKVAANGDGWKSLTPVDVTNLLVVGRNELRVEAENGTGPAGLLGALDITLENGQKISVRTDASWQSAIDAKGRADVAWVPARVLGNNGAGPWGQVTPSAQKTYFPPTYLRRDFTVAQAPQRAVLYVTALGNVEPHLNGERVGDEYFTPGWTDYRKRLYYRAYDVTNRIKAGANTVGAILGDGWFRGNISILGQNRYGKKTRLKAQLHLWFADGRQEIIASDPAWQAGYGPLLTSDMQDGESYDARREIVGWDRPNFQAANWQASDRGAEGQPKIQAYPGVPVRKQGEIKPIAITEPKPNLYVLNLGQNFAGWLRLNINEAAGTKITMRFGEMLNADGTVYRENLRSARAEDIYICKGGGEAWEPQFTFHGFQYVEIEGLSRKPSPENFTGVVIHSDAAQTGSFESSSKLVNKIFQNTLWGQKSNYLEVPTDCPQRDERLGWTGDTQVFVGTGAYNMDVNAFFNKWLNDLEDAQHANGAFPIMAPSHHEGWSPGWADAGVVVPWTMWHVYDDRALLARHYDAMVKHIEFYKSKSPGLIGPDEGFGDWLAIGSDTPKPLISTAYFAHSTAQLAEIAEALGKTEDAAKYRDLFQQIRRAFQAKFVTPDGKVGSGSQTSYLMALRFNLLEENQRAKAAELLVQDIEAHKGHLSTGFLGVNLLLPTLSDIGRSDVAYRLIQNTTYPSWGYSIEQGATTIWERWNSYTKDAGFGPVSMNSFNHYAYGACVEWLYRTVLGIDALTPGYGRILVKPIPGGGLTYARGHFNALPGRISSAWKIEGDTFFLDVTLPTNTTGEIHVPAASEKSVMESSKSVAKTSGLKFLRMEDGAAIYEAQAGSYKFSVKGYKAK